MTIPSEYSQASKAFDALLLDVRDTCMLSSVNQAYHTLRAVLHVFRSHLSVDDALVFAEALPAVPRAMFVEGWAPSDNPKPFPPRDELINEVKAIRPDHNLAPPSAISDVAVCLCRALGTDAFERALSKLPEQARSFWAVECDGASAKLGGPHVPVPAERA